ncbi:membrane-associated protein, putative [Bodo saltans]|uniref:Membrane-associated protein, putative n=1 Tax=Bodo saltans TaxID=75058 RepID=A0A0S4KRP6_BODSA|nr:membrane-associated protein, putative [Bodo saltans]|eukprot:CUM57961.1 membrane-associated protein, putative [Bodo saltans]
MPRAGAATSLLGATNSSGGEQGSGSTSSFSRLVNTPPVPRSPVVSLPNNTQVSQFSDDSLSNAGEGSPSRILSRMLPSCQTITESMQLVRDAFVDLSFLGRVQVLLLLVNLIATFVIVYGVSSGEHRKVDVVSLYFGVEFIVVTAISIIYTVCVENIFAFYGLIVLQLEVVAFVTTSATIGVLTSISPAARWAIVALNWVSIVLFLILQRIVRRSWGWHAYRFAGSSASTVKAFHEYQQFAAVLLLDVFHAVFFLTAEEIIRTHNTIEERVATYTCVALTLAFARITQIVVRYERARIVWVMFVLNGIGVGVYVYFAILATQRAVSGQGRVIDDGENISATGERTLVAAVEWCAVLVRFGLMSSIARVASSFSGALPSLFPRRAARTPYLIDQATIEAAERRIRVASVGPNSPRHIAIPTYDASKRVSSNLTSGVHTNKGPPSAVAATLVQSSTGIDMFSGGLEEYEDNSMYLASGTRAYQSLPSE